MSFMFAAPQVAQQILEPEARRWAVACEREPTYEDIWARSYLERQSKQGGWGGRIYFFGAHELSVGACSLTSRKGAFIGDLSHAQGVGMAGDGDNYFDTDETFAEIAATCPGMAPGNHGLIVLVSDDTASAGDCGAYLGDTQCTVDAGNSLGNLRIRACNPIGNASIPSESNWGPQGYFNINGVTHAVTRQLVAGVERTVTIQQAQVPTAFWPTTKLTVCRVSPNASSLSPIMAVIVVANPVLGMEQDILRTFERIYRVYDTRDAVYGVMHAPRFNGPYPFPRSHIGLVTPPGIAVSRIGKPPASDAVDHVGRPAGPGVPAIAAFVDFPVNLWIGSPNAPAGYDPQNTTDPFKRGNLVWNNRARGPTLTDIRLPVPRGNNAYGRIPVGVGAGQPMYDTYPQAIAAGLAIVAMISGLDPRDDVRYQPGGVPTGWLDLADKNETRTIGGVAYSGAFDTAGFDPVFALPPSAQRTELLTVPRLASPGDPGTTMMDTGDVIHWKFAAENPGIFNVHTDQGYHVYNRVILPPFRDPAPALGGDPRMDEIAMDDEQADYRPPTVHLEFYLRLADLCHALGLKVTASSHDLTAGAKRSGWDVSVNHLILAAIDRYYLKFHRTMPKPATAGMTVRQVMRQWFFAQIDTFRGPSGDVPVPFGKIGISCNIGARNRAMLYEQTAALNELAVEYGLADLQVIGAGANFRARWNDPVNLAKAGLLGIQPSQLVGYGT